MNCEHRIAVVEAPCRSASSARGRSRRRGRARIRLGAILVSLGLAASAVLALGGTQAGATVVDAAPTWPIPADAPAGPPIAALPEATDVQPPAEAIVDPVTPDATCGGWYLQSSYGNHRPAASTWWEYRCTYEYYFYYTPCTSGACDAFCPSCYVEIEDRTDYFYWNSSDSAFYGEDYFYLFYYTENLDEPVVAIGPAWWDAPTAGWYNPGPYPLSVSIDGTGSGEVSVSPPGISCRQSCQPSFDAGTTVTLTATRDESSTFTGWSGDCSGTGSCQVTMDQARSVTATFALKTLTLSVSSQGSGSGTVTSSPAGISCGDNCQASFDTGTVVSLIATRAPGSLFAGWSGDCSGTGSCQLTMDQARSVTATFALNTPPQVSFTVACVGLSCSFDGSGSSDSDGTIADYSWDFGDGASASGRTTSHTYGRAGSYTVALTVTDNAGATASASRAVNPISLSARGYKQNGLQKVGLAWNGASGASFDVYRGGTRIATLRATSYTDNLNKRGSGSYTYKVCGAGGDTRSTDVSVSF